MVDIGLIVRPAESVGTSNIVNPLWRLSSRDVRATSRIMRANWASEHHVFCPLMTKLSPRRSARQEIFAASEPASGSDMLIDMTVPVEIADNAFFFCSSEPNFL